ncbi:MAG: glycosyltransferase [Thermoguttaceae bacterium]
MPKVSVIIPAYNASKTIRHTLKSVFDQTYRDFEVVVVDDGSTDDTVEILKSYGDRVRWAIQKHQGQAFAINTAIGLATGEYLAYFDSDDLMLPTKLEVQAGYLDAHPDVDVVYGDMYVTSPQGERTLLKYSPLDPFYLLQSCCVSRITIMHRRGCLDKTGLFDGTITGSDDWDMWVRMSECCNMAYIDGGLSEYVLHGGNISFRRTNQLSHCRRMRWQVLLRTCRRRGYPLWLRAMMFSAWAYWMVGRVPYFGKRFPYFWAGLTRIQRLGERLLLRGVSGSRKPPEGWHPHTYIKCSCDSSTTSDYSEPNATATHG